jgi:hypothetical protein
LRFGSSKRVKTKSSPTGWLRYLVRQEKHKLG